MGRRIDGIRAGWRRWLIRRAEGLTGRVAVDPEEYRLFLREHDEMARLRGLCDRLRRDQLDPDELAREMVKTITGLDLVKMHYLHASLAVPPFLPGRGEAGNPAWELWRSFKGLAEMDGMPGPAEDAEAEGGYALSVPVRLAGGSLRYVLPRRFELRLDYDVRGLWPAFESRHVPVEITVEFYRQREKKSDG